MKNFLKIFSLLSLISFAANAYTIEFTSVSQANPELTVSVEKNLFSKKLKLDQSTLNVISETEDGLMIAETGIQGQQVILVKGNDYSKISAIIDNFFWEQDWNKVSFSVNIMKQSLFGSCNTDSKVLTGIIFRFSQPDHLGRIDCLKAIE